MMKTLLATLAIAAVLTTGCRHRSRTPLMESSQGALIATAGLPDGDRYRTAAPVERAAKYDPVEDPMITLSVQLSLAVADVGKTQLELMALAKQYGGYLLDSGPQQTRIRVAQNQFLNAVTATEKLGDVSDKRIFGQSLEQSVVGNQDAIQQLEETRTRLFNEIRKSNSPAERQNLERQLQEVEQRLLALGSALNNAKRQVQYATITVNHQKKKTMGPVTALFWAVGKGLGWLFVID